MLYADFRCLKCNFQWSQKPAQVICPKCSHLYIKWENYEECEKEFKKTKGEM